MTRLITTLGLLACLLAAACGSRDTAGLPETALPDLPLFEASLPAPEFPADALQAGESLDSSGQLLQQRNAVASALGIDDEFQAGRDYFDSTGVIGTNGVAATLVAAPTQSAWTIHRIPLGGAQPGLLSVDANLLANGLGGESSYYVAMANFASGRWVWQGPFTDNHVRLSLDSSGDYLSGFGNAYCAVLCYNGSAIDLVGVSLALRDGGDSTPPAQVTGVGGPVLGRGIDLQWDPVPAADLAGYAIYYSHKSFSSPNAAGVNSIGYLEGTTRHLLSVDPGFYEIRVAAVDISGNRGPLSNAVSADVQNNGSLLLNVDTATTLASIGKQLTISVSGAELYDVDMDGDGVYETSAATDTEYSTLLSGAGIIRPRVRGYDALGTHVALGGLSVLVSIANLPPYPALSADKSSPLPGQGVSFSALNSLDLDGSIDKFEWDFDGDGTFDDDTGSTPEAFYKYAKAGSYLAELRVTDDDGDSSSAWLHIQVRGLNYLPIAECLGSDKIELLVVDGNPAIAFNNDANARPYFQRAVDSHGESWNNPVKIYDLGDVDGDISMAIVNGNPAVSFYDADDARGKYARASAADGSAWGAAVEYHPGVDSGFFNDLTVINGNPAVQHGALGLALYTRASNTNGTAWNGTVTLDNFDNPGFLPVLLDTPGRPTALFFRSGGAPPTWKTSDGNDADGTTWGGVQPGGSLLNFDGLDLDAIVLPSGALAASIMINSGMRELVIRYQRDLDVNSWVASETVAKADAMDSVRLGMHDGLPFLVYHENTYHSRLIYMPAQDSFGSAWGPQLILATDNDNYIQSFGVAEIEGRPAIAWKRFSDNFIYYGTIYD